MLKLYYWLNIFKFEIYIFSIEFLPNRITYTFNMKLYHAILLDELSIFYYISEWEIKIK